MKNLHYHEHILTKDSKAVYVLQTDTALRRGILTHVFSEITDQKEIWNLKVHYFSSGFQSHSGLIILKDDILFILSMAFNINNAELWRGFIVSHSLYKNDDLNEVKSIRNMLRQQALAKPEFMRHWACFNKIFKSGKMDDFKRNIKFRRKRKKHEKRKNEINRRGIEFINNNLPLIASGHHLRCLERFSELTLLCPEKIKEEVGDEKLIIQALTNCVDYISSITPTLQEIAKLRCASKRSSLELIWFAACLVILRNQGNLDSVPKNILFALQSTLNFRYKPVSKEEYERLKKEVADILFIGCDSKVKFSCNYIEPQLSEKYEYTNVEIIQSYDAFSELQGEFSIKWLLKFKDLPLSLVNKIFEIAVNYGCRGQLKEIIRQYMYDAEQKMMKDSTDEQVKSELYFWTIREFCFFEKIQGSHWEFFTRDKNNLLLLHHKIGRINQNEFQGWPKLTSDKIEKILDAFYEKWPVVELPSSWGTHSPKGETAYRFLTDLIWNINSDNPDNAIPVLMRLLNDKRFLNSRSELQSILASQRRKKLLLDFKPPSAKEVVSYLDKNEVISVEGIRKVVLQELTNFQKSIDGGEFNSADRFYENGVRLDEVKSTEIIAERLSLKLEHKNIAVTLEHQLKSHNRSDFTASGIVNGRKRLLVTEVKGQWHRELYTAAEKQLYERYSIHPAAEQQGIFLVLWFGKNEKIAGKINHGIKTATELKIKIESELPYELRGLVDIFVLDISKEI